MLKLNVVKKRHGAAMATVSGQEGTGQGDSQRSKASRRTSAKRRAHVRQASQCTHKNRHTGGEGRGSLSPRLKLPKMPLNSMTHSNKRTVVPPPTWVSPGHPTQP